MSIAKEDLNIITQSINKEVKKAVGKILEANKQAEEQQRDYFKETERLLYSYPALKLKIEQDEEDLQNDQMVVKRKSTSFVRYGGTGGVSTYDPEADYLESRKASMERTKREITRIDRALETIQDDQYYDIIPMKYWDDVSPEKIAEKLNCDERTYRRNKNRLVNKLKIVLFGSDALNY